MSKVFFGKLECILLCKVWVYEVGEFMFWLVQVENLQLLVEVLGLVELELVVIEYLVGDFKVDILCLDNGGKVIIENQLEGMDYWYLGQIFIYVVNVGVCKVVWLVEFFCIEYVVVLEFLNQYIIDELDFFVVEIEFWCIGDLFMVFSFNVVVKFNDWVKIGQQNVKVVVIMMFIKQW